MMKPAWIVEAQKYIGLKEFPGAANNAIILRWWKAIRRGGIKLDSVPWCAAFVGGCLENVGITSSRFESAKSYLTWGMNLSAPIYGCIVVFERNGGGHVGFLIGQDSTGRLMILGGNQGDKVSIAPFDVDRVAGYRWPGTNAPMNREIPYIANLDQSSRNEA